MSLQDPDLKALVALMADTPSVPEGWDVAITLSVPVLNALVRTSWESQPPIAPSLRWAAPADAGSSPEVLEIEAPLPPPLLGLNASTGMVDLTFTLSTGAMRRSVPGAAPRLPGTAQEDDGVAWSAPEPITAQTPVRVVTEVPVSVLATAEAFVVGLDFGAAALRLSDRLPGLATTSAPLAAVPALDARGLIARLDRQAGPDPTLVPVGVSTRIAPTKDGRATFQILTGPTAGRSLAAAVLPALVPAAASAQGEEPAPGIAVQVSSQATMDMIARAYNQGTGVIKILAMPPADPAPHWFLQVHEPMVFEGTFGSAEGQVYVRDHSCQYLCFAGSPDQDLKLFTVIDPTSTVRLHLDLAAHYPTVIDGGVGLSEGGQSVTGEGFYESIVRPQLEAFLVGDIRADMTRVRLTPLNELLLQRLTLPGHTVHLEEAALPGETLVVGSVRPSA